MVEEVFEEKFIVPLQKLFEGKPFGRSLFFIKVVDIEVFIEKSLIFEMGWEELIFFFKEVHHLVVHRLIILAVLVQLSDEVVEDLIGIVKLIVLDDLLLGLVGQSVSSQPVSLEPD